MPNRTTSVRTVGTARRPQHALFIAGVIMG